VLPDGDDASFIGIGDEHVHNHFSRPGEEVISKESGYLRFRNLEGTIVSPCYVLRDLNGSLKAYFIFPDLSVNVEGKYMLKICVSSTSRYVLLK
jgi:hypothetical protein